MKARTFPDTNSGRSHGCPICGRTKDGDCRFSSDMAFCHHGSSLAPPTGLNPADVITGQDGNRWAYVSTASGASGTSSTFVRDRPIDGDSKPSQVKQTTIEQVQARPVPLPLEPVQFAPLTGADLKDGISQHDHDFWFHYDGDNLITKRVPKVKSDGTPDKDFIPHHQNGQAPKLTKGNGPTLWPLWQHQDLKNITGSWVLEFEGEKCANYGRTGGVICTSQPGHARTVKQRALRYAGLKNSGALGVVYVADNDHQGQVFAQDAIQAAANAALPLIVIPAAELHEQMPEKGSIDDLCLSADRGGLGLSADEAIQAILLVAHDKQQQSQQQPETYEAEAEIESASLADIAETVTKTEQAAALTLDPTALIGGKLGDALNARADRLHVPSAVLLNGLLPAAASQLPRSVRVMLNEDSDFSQPAIIWSLSVAPTGSNKTETSDISVMPIYRMQDELAPDVDRHFFTSSFTLPGLSRVQAAQPEHGCLIHPDELSGFVRKLQGDQQKGTTDDLSRLLSIYDGKPLRGTFSDKSLNYNLKGSSFSLLSTIQPSVLLECMGDLDDSSGLWARFNLCEIPLRRRRMTRTGRSSDGLMSALKNAYLCLQSWEPLLYGLTDEAAELFDDFYNACEDQRLDQTLQPALRAYAAKQEGRCGRVALVLHCLQAAARQVPPTHLISAETMLGAITICDFYQQQLRRFYTLALAHISESLEGQTLLVFEFIKNTGGQPCSVRQINKGPRALRKMTTKQIEQALEILTNQNLIKKGSEGWSLITI